MAKSLLYVQLREGKDGYAVTVEKEEQPGALATEAITADLRELTGELLVRMTVSDKLEPDQAAAFFRGQIRELWALADGK